MQCLEVFVPIALAVTLSHIGLCGHTPPEPRTSPNRWKTITEKPLGFAISLPAGSTASKRILDHSPSVIIDPPLTSFRGRWGVSIRVTPNPKRLTAEQIYRANLARLDRQQKQFPDMPFIGSESRDAHPITIRGQKGMERKYVFANGHLIKEVTLAWGKFGYQVSYEVSNMDMSAEERFANPARIKLLDAIIGTIRPAGTR